MTTLDIAQTDISDEIVESAVTFINDRVAASQRNILEIGKYVLDHFFDGSAELAASKDPNKNVSFQRLARHPGLLINRTTLSRAVALYIQQQELLAADHESASLLTQVSPTHQQTILSVKGVDTKIALLQKAVDHDLSTRALRRIVDIEKKKTKSPRGRKPLTALQKVWRQCYRVAVSRSQKFPEDRNEFFSRFDGTVTASTKKEWLLEIEEALGFLRAVHETVNMLSEIDENKRG